MKESDMESQVFVNVGDTISANLAGEVVRAIVESVHEDLSEVSTLQGRGVIARCVDEDFPYCFRIEDIYWVDSASFRAKLKKWGLED